MNNFDETISWGSMYQKIKLLFEMREKEIYCYNKYLDDVTDIYYL